MEALVFNYPTVFSAPLVLHIKTATDTAFLDISNFFYLPTYSHLADNYKQ